MIKIVLSDELGNNILTRKALSAIFEKINSVKVTEIILDFKDIDFISRSCADEYLKQKEDSHKKIIERNISKEVCLMFNAVKSQYEKAGLKISFVSCALPKQEVAA
jgi:hypothetical protein